MSADGRPATGPGSPSDWVSGERVFGPPLGTFDVDWLVPAVVEQAGAHPTEARAALQQVWAGHRTGGVQHPAGHDAVELVARQVLAAALEQYRIRPSAPSSADVAAPSD
jgi:hypothetical protein